MEVERPRASIALGPHGDDVSSPFPHRDKVAAVVPFSWELKPGVCRQPIYSIEKKLKDTTSSHATLSSSQEPALLLQCLMEHSKLSFPLPTPPARLHTSPPLTPTSSYPKSPNGGSKESKLTHSKPQRNSPRRQVNKNMMMVRAKDDPFLMAIEACTKLKSTRELKGSMHNSSTTNNNKASPRALLGKLFENEEPSPRKDAYNGHPAFTESFQSKNHERSSIRARHHRGPSHGISPNKSFGGCMGCRSTDNNDSIVRL